jgi:hypothetical protein
MLLVILFPVKTVMSMSKCVKSFSWVEVYNAFLVISNSLFNIVKFLIAKADIVITKTEAVRFI